FIVNPLHTKKSDNLFSTHPSTANRVAALQDLARTMSGSGGPRPAGSVPVTGQPARRRGPWR
ncbi:MAG: hypothetical protein P1U37_18100, partial [Minwuia sp.]|nr:hypothetical protein [Minwuia sp.]